MKIRTLVLLFTLGRILDILTTGFAVLVLGIPEANPFVRGLISTYGFASFSIPQVLAIIVFYLYCWLIQEFEDVWAFKFFRDIVLLFTVGIGFWNIYAILYFLGAVHTGTLIPVLSWGMVLSAMLFILKLKEGTNE